MRNAKKRVGVRQSHGPLGRFFVETLLFIAFVLLFCTIILYFKRVDVYHHHFFDRAYSALYNLCRLLLAAYLFWLVYFSGHVVLKWRCHRALVELSAIERVAASFFVGAALWQGAMVVLGYLSLYRWPLIAAVTLPVVALSYRHLRHEVAPEISRSFAARIRPFPGWRALGSALMLGPVLASGFVLFLVKGLYPAGGHDYWTHYFYFFTTALDKHGIWPNEVWYHYFYSKAHGLFFLGMLLSDPLAPSFVTFCFVAAAACALYRLLDRNYPGTYWPPVAVTVFLALYLYTPRGQFIVGAADGWGDFQKGHEVNACFVVAVLWMSARLLSASDDDRRLWWSCAAICTVAATYTGEPTGILVGCFTLILSLVSLARSNWRSAYAFLGLALVAGAAFVSQLVLNYVTTGVPLDAFEVLLWDIVNLRKIESLGWTFDVIAHMRGLMGLAAHRLSLWSGEMAGLLFDVFRLQNTASLFLGLYGALFLLAAIGSMSIIRRHLLAAYVPVAIVLAAFAATIIIAAVSFGATQPISFFRYSSFGLPVTIACAATAWQALASTFHHAALRAAIRYAVPIGLLIFTLGDFWSIRQSSLVPLITNAVGFATGRMSIADAFTNQSGWPTRFAYGAIHPGTLKAFQQVPRGARIWSFHIHSYCMAPDCRIESADSFVMSPHTFELMFGPAEDARALLHREGLDYFILSTDLGVRDWHIAAPLLAPDHIADNLGIKWTDGTTYLLTWIGPGVEPLSPEWVAKYRTMTATISIGALADMTTVYSELKRKPVKWGADLSLPWRPSVKANAN